MKKKVNKYVIPRNNNIFEKKQKEVNQLFKTKDYPKIIIALNELLAMDNNNLVTLDDLGSCYFNMENYEKSIEYYQKILKIDKNNLGAFINSANAYCLLNNYEMSMKYINSVLKIDDTNISGLLLAGISEFNIGKFNDSLNYFKKIVAEYENVHKDENENAVFISSLISIALIYCESDDFITAKKHLSTAFTHIKSIKDGSTGRNFDGNVDTFVFSSSNIGIFTDYYYAYSLAIHKENIDEAIESINIAIKTANTRSDLYKQAAYYYYLKNEKELFRNYMNESIKFEQEDKLKNKISYGKYYQAARIPENILIEMTNEINSN